MPKSRVPYPPEFRQQMIELVHAGGNPEELAQEFGCSAQSIRNWWRKLPSTAVSLLSAKTD
jgi:transposase